MYILQMQPAYEEIRMAYPTTPALFYNTQFRQYRLRLEGNKFHKIKYKIRTPKELKAILDKMMPEDVYQTISWWLNPEDLGQKRVNSPGSPRLDNLFLGSDYLMDFDEKDYQERSEMLHNIRLAQIYLKEHGMIQQVLMRTGRGYQLVVIDFFEWAKVKVESPRDREYAYGYKMRKLTKDMLNKGIKWDSDVSIDTRRIFRVPNTMHRNGKKIMIIAYSEKTLIFGG